MFNRYSRSNSLGLFMSPFVWILPTTTVLLSMFFYFLSGPRAIPFFVSESDLGQPQSSLFTIGLMTSGVVLAVFAFSLHKRHPRMRATKWDPRTITLLGLLSSGSLAGVGWFDMYQHVNPHIGFSIFAFGGGLAWSWLIASQVMDITSPFRRIIMKFCLIGLMADIVMVIAFQWATSSITTTHLTPESFLNQAQAGINIAAPAEYVLIACLLANIALIQRWYDSTMSNIKENDGQNENHTLGMEQA